MNNHMNINHHSHECSLRPVATTKYQRLMLLVNRAVVLSAILGLLFCAEVLAQNNQSASKGKRKLTKEEYMEMMGIVKDSSSIRSMQELSEVHRTTPMYESLEEALKEPEKVYRLNLSQRNLTSVPPEIAQLKNLRVLSLFGNELSELPDAIAQLQNLESLDLGRNQFTKVPPQVLKLKKLKVLYLSANQIRELPPGFYKMTSLLLFDIAGNQISKVSPEIGNLTNLMEINFRVNRIETIPSTIGKLKKLQMLRLNENPISPKEVRKLEKLLKVADIRVLY